jgi:hypothetical protein
MSNDNNNNDDDNDFGDNSVGIVGGGIAKQIDNDDTSIPLGRYSSSYWHLAFGVGIVHVSLNRSNNNSNNNNNNNNSSTGGGISNVEGGNNEEESNSSEAGIMGVGDRFEDFDAESMTKH